ncbi:THUMP domain-containing protein [Aspergillus ruber CBS 135680]|uniref:THUMP domain protein n=1 Tax=Aspergillus ruber (strain CBS 135680) TaxID=1388766 RepID=A0A017SCH8_ASPRC|nr:THUMP domain protein [Aspergillus ruber CBS 135680]EYE94622.1 THUMP domain protein [Aspergillus ruber CBS 135680]
MPGTGKRAMPGDANQSAKRRKGGGAKYQKQQSKGTIVESGDWGVFVTCDMGRESKCIREALDIFSQSAEDTAGGDDDGESSSNEDDIEAQIRREVEGLKPGKEKPRKFQAIRMEVPCVAFIKFDKSIDPVQMVHKLCLEAQAHPEKKRGRYIQRMTPMVMMKKTLSVDLEAFAKEILEPHFHSGGPPKKFAIRPSIVRNTKFDRNTVIKTIASAVGGGHSVDLKNYDALILITVIQNIMGMSVVEGDYDQLKRYNLAELYSPTPKPQASEKKESETTELKS